MSTRCNILFTWGKTGHTVEARIYRHCDGYPSGVLPDLKAFFKAVEEQTKGGMGGNRFDDPSYLAAKFVVWQAAQYASSPDKPLDFISLGVCSLAAQDLEYIYTVDCSEHDAKGYPKVTYRAV